jgi:hypothetical protein
MKLPPARLLLARRSLPRPCCAVLAQGPPITNGLTGFYVGDSYNATANKWMDISGAGNHATTSGTITRVPLGINGEDFLRGRTTTKVTLPQTFVGDTYTFFHVCRCAHRGSTEAAAPPPFPGLLPHACCSSRR